MKEIDKKQAPNVSGGYRPGDGGCIPQPFQLPTQLPGEPSEYPQCPMSPPAPDVFVTDPPSV